MSSVPRPVQEFNPGRNCLSENTLTGVRIFLVDDHPAVRQGLSLLLHQEGIVVCGEAASREEALRYLEEADPDLVLVDLSLGNENGLDLIREVAPRGVMTLVYSMYDDALHVESAFAAGAVGYVTKRETAATLLAAVREVLSGQRFFSPVIARILADKLISNNPRIPVERLSDREMEVFRRTGEGDTAAEMAELFAISPRTVESYYARIIEKLELSGVKAMRRLAIQYIKET